MRLKRFSQWVTILLAAGSAWGQTQAPPTVIRTETKLVLVDVVVANKKGQYIDNLELKDFRVWEDNKEQALKTFSYGPDPAAPGGGKRYIVLFFDSMTLSSGDLAQTRLAAQHFIESNAGPDRAMLVASFYGSLQIAQNFTADIGLLKASLDKVRASAIIRGPDMAVMGGLNRMDNMDEMTGVRIDPTQEFAARQMLTGLRNLARSLADIPGRKSLVLFSSGFPLSNLLRDETMATISYLNRANVAVYAVDARGMSGGVPMRGLRGQLEWPGAVHADGIALAAWPVTRIAGMLLDPQARGGGAPGGGAPAGGGTTGGGASGGGVTRGGGGMGGSPTTGGGNPGMGRTTGMPGSNPGMNNPGGMNGGRGTGMDPYGNNSPFNNNNPMGRRNGPFGMELPGGIMDRQQVLHLLAEGTGGFVILNTNDFTGNLAKIAKEQNAYYILGYTPPPHGEGTCHTLKVKVDKGGTNVRSRAGYCDTKPKDVLAGNPVEKTLESRAAGASKGTIAASMTAPYFFTGPDTARVAVALEIPTEKIKFEKVKGKQHAEINVLGVAYAPDGTVAARFSDVVKEDLDGNKEVEQFRKSPLHYENQFDIASGSYTFKVVFDSGNDNFGKLETPLAINKYDAKQFAVSALALCKKFGPASAVDTGIDALLLEGRSPLIAGNLQFTPSGYVRFSKSDNVAMYFEIYDPALTGDKPPKVAVELRFLDAKTGNPLSQSGTVALDTFIRPGSATVPAALKVPVNMLPPGEYRAEVKAGDSTGTWAVRTTDFEVMQ